MLRGPIADTAPYSGLGLPSGTVTFLFTDVVGSTERWERHAAAMGAALARHDVSVMGQDADVQTVSSLVRLSG